MNKTRRTKRRRSDWQGRETLVAAKVTSPELIQLIRYTDANGGNRAEVIRRGLRAIGAIGQGAGVSPNQGNQQ